MIYMFMKGIRPPYKVCSYVLAFIQDYSPQLYYKSVTEELIGYNELKFCFLSFVPAFRRLIWGRTEEPFGDLQKLSGLSYIQIRRGCPQMK